MKVWFASIEDWQWNLLFLNFTVTFHYEDLRKTSLSALITKKYYVARNTNEQNELSKIAILYSL